MTVCNVLSDINAESPAWLNRVWKGVISSFDHQYGQTHEADVKVQNNHLHLRKMSPSQQGRISHESDET